MALYYDLLVYRDTYQLILKIFACTKDFPKDYKYTLGQNMKRDALQLVRSIYCDCANKAAIDEIKTSREIAMADRQVKYLNNLSSG